MAMFDRKTFKAMATGNVYPYNEIASTRTCFRTKWILVRAGGGETGILFSRSNLFPILSSCLDNNIATELIVNKKALPLPHDYIRIMDVMEHWGRTISPSWYRSVLSLFHYLLSIGSKVSHKLLTYECVQHRVIEMLDSSTNVNRPRILERWNVFFAETYLYYSRDYFACCVQSFMFVRNVVAEQQQEQDSVEDSSSIVPVTPVSSQSAGCSSSSSSWCDSMMAVGVVTPAVVKYE